MGTLWKHAPWLAAFLAAPLLLGSVHSEGQAIIALLLGTSALLLTTRSDHQTLEPGLSPAWTGAAVVLLLLPLIPLPAELVRLLSPERWNLARDFPLDPAQAPHWISLGFSPSGTIQRLWELGLVVTVFALSRRAAALREYPRALAWTVATSVILVAGSEVWFRMTGAKTMPDVSTANAVNPAGAFADRNHFASWILVSILFLSGWVLRNLDALHGARSDSLPRANRLKTDAGLVVAVILFGMVMTVACGARGPLVGCLAGVAVWASYLAVRSRSKKRWILTSSACLMAFLAAIAVSELYFRSTGASDDTGLFNTNLWEQSLAMALHFPLFGVGWGGFDTAFCHYKTAEFAGLGMLAENDLIQLFVETGFIGLFVCLIIALRYVRLAAVFGWSRRMPEPELFFGAMAALTAFIAHSLFNGVFQIPANAMMAAVLLGFVTGVRERKNISEEVSAVPSWRVWGGAAWAVILIVGGVFQGAASMSRHEASAEKMPAEVATKTARAMQLWPWDSIRNLKLIQAQVQLLPPKGESPTALAAIHEQLDKSLAWDPLNCPLRLERAWFNVKFATNAIAAREEAWRVVRLGPSQSDIPLNFAKHFAESNPAATLAFLRVVTPGNSKQLNEIYSLAWNSQHQTNVLWSLAPRTRDGIMTLGDFAVEQKLNDLASMAFRQLSNQVPNLVLAERLLGAHDPAAAFTLIPRPPTTLRAQLVLSRTYLDLGRYPEAIRQAETLWTASKAARSLLIGAKDDGNLDMALESFKKDPANPELALRVAEHLFEQPTERRNLARLRSLSEDFPKQYRICWMVFQTEMGRRNYPVAAQLAIRIASVVYADE